MAPKIISPEELAERERVGATLRTLRQTRGWKPDEFAGQLNISRPYLSNIEAGRKALPDHILARAARVLDVEQIAIKRPNSSAAVA